MAMTPITVPNRPFAVEPLTGIMMPDGVFDASIFTQRITCHIKNTDTRDLLDVSVYFEGVGDPGIVPVPFTHAFPRIPAGASVMVGWTADFRNASPGKPIVSIVAQEAGASISRSLKRIYVSRTTYDVTSRKFVCEVPEGRLEVTNLTAIGPDGSAWEPPPEPNPKHKGRDGDEGLGPYLPTGIDAVFVPNPAYAGTHGDLPFNDPWWKLVALIVALIAAVVGAILAATGGGAAAVGIKGSFDETGSVDPAVSCCKPDFKSTASATGLDKGKVTAAGVASAISSAALTVAFFDEEDPWWRGQRATPPANGDLTLAERVTAEIEYIDPPNAGMPYKVKTSWVYERQTTGSTLTHEVTEERANTHLAESVEVIAPQSINAFAEPLVIKARFTRPGGAPYQGAELFAFALLISPEAEFATIVDLVDDGIDPDERADDGTYTGSAHLEEFFKLMRRLNFRFEGRWRILVFAQDVNLADEADPPEIQAQTIGGFVIASPITITFDTSLPCPITAQAVVNVFT